MGNYTAVELGFHLLPVEYDPIPDDHQHQKGEYSKRCKEEEGGLVEGVIRGVDSTSTVYCTVFNVHPKP